MSEGKEIRQQDIEALKQRIGQLELREADLERIQSELCRERDRARQYLDVAGVIIVALDPHGNIALINMRGCEILDYTEEELLGRNWFDLFVPEDIRTEVMNVHKRICAGEDNMQEFYKNVIQTKPGQQHIIAWHNRTFKDEHGTILGALSSGTDITEEEQVKNELLKSQKELEKHRDHLEEIVNIRTRELRTIVNAMAGREIRMTGLKKIIKQLREQIITLGEVPVADDPLNIGIQNNRE